MNTYNEYIKMYNLGICTNNHCNNINVLLNKISEYGECDIPYVTNVSKVKKLG